MKVWITKYALSVGIQVVDDATIVEATPSMISYPTAIGTTYIHLPFWHTSMESAISHTEKLIQKRMASLRKAIKKLEEMKQYGVKVDGI